MEVLEETPTDPLRVNVRYWETYDGDKDIRDRVYAPAYWNSQDQEEYTTRYQNRTPKNWEEMRDTLGVSAVVIPRTFTLTPRRTLPREVYLELIPFISVHVVALPLAFEQKGPQKPLRHYEFGSDPDRPSGDRDHQDSWPASSA